MTIARCCAELKVNGVQLIITREILAAVDTVVTDLVRVVEVHCISLIQIEFLITFFTIRKLVLRSNVIPTDCLLVGAWVSEVGVNCVGINNVLVHDIFTGRFELAEPVLTLV